MTFRDPGDPMLTVVPIALLLEAHSKRRPLGMIVATTECEVDALISHDGVQVADGDDALAKARPPSGDEPTPELTLGCGLRIKGALIRQKTLDTRVPNDAAHGSGPVFEHAQGLSPRWPSVSKP
jgi:hypothetical protein